jgi:hypothetical protein
LEESDKVKYDLRKGIIVRRRIGSGCQLVQLGSLGYPRNDRRRRVICGFAILCVVADDNDFCDGFLCVCLGLLDSIVNIFPVSQHWTVVKLEIR